MTPRDPDYCTSCHLLPIHDRLNPFAKEELDHLLVGPAMPKARANAKPDPGFNDLTNVFVLSSNSGATQGLLEVPKSLDVETVRQRRAHQKSRAGCDNCRARRIKVGHLPHRRKSGSLAHVIHDSAMKAHHVKIVRGGKTPVVGQDDPHRVPRLEYLRVSSLSQGLDRGQWTSM